MAGSGTDGEEQAIAAPDRHQEGSQDAAPDAPDAQASQQPVVEGLQVAHFIAKAMQSDYDWA